MYMFKGDTKTLILDPTSGKESLIKQQQTKPQPKPKVKQKLILQYRYTLKITLPPLLKFAIPIPDTQEQNVIRVLCFVFQTNCSFI